ncbi:diacylglycerol/lipid kinase family protein [Dyadobacter tibetensis]|uniref:diacylglycerol/lipid kinase family protein n=1 Tax=Dyadobacter tibetensis TaxID=1211851 RepID=UPI000471C8F3|nr:diacylglycerol kinase family protein [Dyadobacter tibetensis]
MAIVQIFHNPGAGTEDHSKKWLIRTLNEQGFTSVYRSTAEKNWQKLDASADFIVLAGGDGTVRKVASELLNRKLIEKKYPIALHPLGTANNVARTLGLSTCIEELSTNWWTGDVKSFDIGLVEGLDEPAFFLESLGFGLFPKLLKNLESQDQPEHESPKEEIRHVLKVFHQLVESYEPKECHIEIDGEDYSGEYLWVEVMNTPYMGSNLHLAPGADPGDGYLDVVMIAEKDRKNLLKYLAGKIIGKEPEWSPPCQKASKVKLAYNGVHGHIDDKYLKLKKFTELKVHIQRGILDFIVPA